MPMVATKNFLFRTNAQQKVFLLLQFLPLQTEEI